ncbi:type VI secretion system ATPase TssH [Pantoea vagans]|uniref:Molecular chaperone n=3 Tax=Pantoea TaxID=53335 RepID=A0A0U3TC07_9GAMM|nr:type VI secretion system ATPase TssH [Pantoea vagans]ALV92325.1 molecular chaperone [Pantoea vagans]
MSDIRRNVLFSKLNHTLFTSLESATAFCKLRGNPYVELVHWLHQLWQLPNGDLQLIARRFELDSDLISQDLIAALDRLPRGASAVTDLAEHIDNAVERAWIYCSLSVGESKIRGGHLLLALLKTATLKHVTIAISGEFARISADRLLDDFNDYVQTSDEQQQISSDNVTQSSASPAGENVLAKYGRDLTAEARAGNIDPVVGRDEEIRQMVDILLRRRQNNPLLTGEAGVGKTALAEGLAQCIASGSVPPPLQQVQLWLLDIGLLQAGASVKGEFEARLQAVINQVQASPQPIVLFIDEIHTLVGAGGQQGTGDAANLLKPALARGQLRTVGATTWAEYKKYIEKDPALTRRFQPVQVAEPDEQTAILMLRHLAQPLSQHHQVLLLDEALQSAVRLSQRYIPARQLPDKAIALLDTACARVAVSLHHQPPELAFCRQQLAALQLEIEIAQREARLGFDSAPARITAAQQQQLLLRSEEQMLDQRWQQALALTQQMSALQAELRMDQDAERTARYQALQQQLDALQGDTPLTFPAVDSGVVASVVADWTGIPLGRMLQSERDAVLNLAQTLANRVIGQPAALNAIAQRIQTSRAGLDDPGKPIGVFMLCGPSGTGKTETALALAETLYGGEQNLITINMSEFQEAHSVSTLKGAPPGYVGYGEGGVLTEAVRRRPYSVVLLDEIEKAHPDVHEIFFQVFDKGWMEDGEGRRIDFRNTVIILTSNIGSDELAQACSGPAPHPDSAVLNTLLRAPLREVFPAALLGRLAVVPYLPLSDEMLIRIIDLRLAKIQQRLRDRHEITAAFSPSVAQQIMQRCTEGESGGRMVDAVLSQTLLPQISCHLLSEVPTTIPRHLNIDYQDAAFQLTFSAETAHE